MRCLSIRQPWAWAVCLGAKSIENRSWPTDYRGTLAIHASSSREDLQKFRDAARDDQSLLAFGAIIGVADVIDCRPLDTGLEKNDWAEGPWCWTLANARLLSRPIPLRGRANLFPLPADVVESLHAELASVPSSALSPASNELPASNECLARIQPRPFDVALARAESYLKLKQPGELIRLANQLLELDPECGRAFWLKAVGLAALNRHGEALDDVERAIEKGWSRVVEERIPDDNLAALHHAALCLAAADDVNEQERAHGFFGGFAGIANVRMRDFNLAARGYAAYRQFSPAAAIRAYAVRDSAFDHDDGLNRLLADGQSAGLENAELDNLRLAVAAAQVARCKQSIQIVNSRLDDRQKMKI